MITAKDINTKRFEQARPGYKTEEVDDFLKEIADQITAMIKEKEDTDKKIEVLVESIRRYKADEEALKDAMIGAQKQAKAVMSEAREKADAIVAEAQQKAEQIISAANVKADEVLGTTSARLEKEKVSLERMQNAVKDFKRELMSMYRSHLELITALPEIEDEEESETEQEYEIAEETAAEDVQEESQEEPASNPAYDSAMMDQTRVIETPVSDGGLKFGAF